MGSLTLPEFPAFSRLSIHHKGEIDAHIIRTAPYTEFTFASMWCWNLEESASLAALNGNLVLKHQEYPSGLPYLSFLGGAEARKTALALMTYSEGKLARSQLCLVPEISVSHEPEELSTWLDIHEDRDNFDYVLDLQAVASYAGPSFRGKRQATARFERNNSPTTRELDLTDGRDQALVLAAFEHWSESRGRSQSSVHDELRALQRVFRIWPIGSLVAIGVLSANRLVAFTICETFPNQFAVGLFSKADVRIGGVFEFLRRAQACHLLQRGYKWLSIQQDMGLPGLRQAKMSYRPIRFLRKYTLHRRERDAIPAVAIAAHRGAHESSREMGRG